MLLHHLTMREYMNPLKSICAVASDNLRDNLWGVDLVIMIFGFNEY
jgi:hypothetical protein